MAGDDRDGREINIVIFLSLLSESFNIMLNRFISQAGKSLTIAPRFAYIQPPKHSETHHHVTPRLPSPASLPNASSSVSTKDSTESIPNAGT
jgi:hypothetical protein